MARESTGHLFDEPADEQAIDPEAPLADRMRPRSLDEFVGQSHLIGPGTLLRRSIEENKPLPSLILWGGPGTGKTSLARILARSSGGVFVPLSAVFSGVREVRAAIDEARKDRRRGVGTILFIDEIHRFNKAQQDALLPSVEDGTITLIGATTENPSFEVIGALLSRTRVLTLNPLSDEEIATLLRRALVDAERGLAALKPGLDVRQITMLAGSAAGDARVALSAVEAAVVAAPVDSNGGRPVTDDLLVEALGRARFAYDKGGEDHYNLISALIKSVRNSNVNAALYWLARLIEGGADPLFIARRLCILASEDVGLADPQAMVQAAAAAEITRLIGFPEAVFPLSQATIYLARAPKSNAVLRSYAAAAADATLTAREPVPLQQRNAVTNLMKLSGYGAGYRYIHEDPDAKGEMPCLPESLQGHVYFEQDAIDQPRPPRARKDANSSPPAKRR
jgi:putative ATPase